eukprot:scaffold71620_cov62-Cyclotella_meneghiniana.AAC.2
MGEANHSSRGSLKTFLVGGVQNAKFSMWANIAAKPPLEHVLQTFSMPTTRKQLRKTDRCSIR